MGALWEERTMSTRSPRGRAYGWALLLWIGLAAGALQLVRAIRPPTGKTPPTAARITPGGSVPERSFRLLWRAVAGLARSPHDPVFDLLCADGRLDYVCV